LLPGLEAADERKELSKMLLTFSEAQRPSSANSVNEETREAGELSPQGGSH